MSNGLKAIITATFLTFVVAIVLTGILSGRHQELQPVTVNAQVVERVVDGDTVVLKNGQRVRLIGVDAPERGCEGYSEAKDNLKRLVEGKRIVLVADGKQDVDRYGRLVRYMDHGTIDVGLQQIKDDQADARYDSRDGYPKHSRQDTYIKADESKENVCQNK